MNLTPICIFLGLALAGTVIGIIMSGRDDAKKLKKFKELLEEKKKNGV